MSGFRKFLPIFLLDYCLKPETTTGRQPDLAVKQLWSQTAWVQIPRQLITRYVIPHKLLCFTVVQFPH